MIRCNVASRSPDLVHEIALAILCHPSFPSPTHQIPKDGGAAMEWQESGARSDGIEKRNGFPRLTRTESWNLNFGFFAFTLVLFVLF